MWVNLELGVPQAVSVTGGKRGAMFTLTVRLETRSARIQAIRVECFVRRSLDQ